MTHSDRPFQQIAIVGLGLIGGSWGLALKRQGYAGTRVGCDRESILKRALVGGAIDRAEPDAAASVRDADLVILAAPASAILALLGQLKGAISPRALVTDVGSTKVLICDRAYEVFGNAPLFLGGHPLAGKERSGFESAEPKLFDNASYALVPRVPQDLEDPRVKRFISLVSDFGAKPFVTNAHSHDRAVAYLSHLPQLLSTGLASLIAEAGPEPLPLELAAGGFRDVTRLAESPYPLWRDICRTNLQNIREALDAFLAKLERLKQDLPGEALERDFIQAAKLRAGLREKP
ncbi:MAG: prephenate dehydrogenase [Terriglobia bacterium]